MNCPMCSADMTEGFILGRAPGVKFKAQRDLLGDLGGTRITSGIFNHRAAAFRCDSCTTVVVPPTNGV